MDRTLGIEELLNEAGWLRRLAASLVHDGAQAEDLVQDTWVAALRHPPGQGEPRPWLGRVVRNLAKNRGRDRARREAREAFVHAEPTTPTPAALAQEAEAQRLLAEAVTRLEEPLRAVIVLRYFQGLDSGAAAERLGVPASTLRTRQQRALEELRADLDRRVDGGRRSWALLLAPLARSPGAGAAAAGAVGLGSTSTLLVACAGVAAVLGTIGVTYWSLTQEASVDAGAVLAESTLAPSLEPAPSARANDQREPLAPPDEGASSAASAAAAAPSAPSAPNAAGAAELASAELSGTLLVDGRPPEWPIVLTLEPRREKRPEIAERAVVTAPGITGVALRRQGPGPAPLTIEPEQRGAFSFTLPTDWSGLLRVEDYTFADGESSFAIERPATGLVLHLRSGPEIVGRIVGPDGAPIPGLQGHYAFRIGETGKDANEENFGWPFRCRADGAFRIPSKTRGDWGALTLLVEDEHGYLLHGSPTFVPAAGLDLGELALEPVRALSFRVTEPDGTPIEGAQALVDGPTWAQSVALTGSDGSGLLATAPDRPVGLLVRARAHADRVLRLEPGDAVHEVALAPLSVLEVSVAVPGAERVLVTAERAAFVWDEGNWGEDAAFQEGLAEGRMSGDRRMRRPAAAGRYEYEFALPAGGILELVGLVDDIVLSVEAQDAEGRSLAVGTVSVARGRRAVLQLGSGEPSGPTLRERLPLKRQSKS